MQLGTLPPQTKAELNVMSQQAPTLSPGYLSTKTEVVETPLLNTSDSDLQKTDSSFVKHSQDIKILQLGTLPPQTKAELNSRFQQSSTLSPGYLSTKIEVVKTPRAKLPEGETLTNER